MFESVVTDSGDDGLRRAAKTFRVAAAMIALGTAFLTVTDPHLLRFIVNAALAIAAWAIAQGIDDRKPWAKRAGYVFAVLALFSFPFGTVVGIALLVYLRRASKAGLFQRR